MPNFLRDDINCIPFRVNGLLSVILGLLEAITIASKLEGGSFSWFYAFFPFWIIVLINVTTYTAVPILANIYPQFMEEVMKVKREYMRKIVTTGIFVGAATLPVIIIFILLALQLDGKCSICCEFVF
jgi:hypothetical protein